MRPLASQLAEEVDLSVYRSSYDADDKRVDAAMKEAQNLIPPIRKHTFARDIDPSTLIDDEAMFKALTGINWATADIQ